MRDCVSAMHIIFVGIYYDRNIQKSMPGQYESRKIKVKIEYSTVSFYRSGKICALHYVYWFFFFFFFQLQTVFLQCFHLISNTYLSHCSGTFCYSLSVLFSNCPGSCHSRSSTPSPLPVPVFHSTHQLKVGAISS